MAKCEILDFGLTKLRNVSKLTRAATTLGTHNYMSPEQLQGLEVDVRSKDAGDMGNIRRRRK